MLFKDYWEKVEIVEGRERERVKPKNFNSIRVFPLLAFFEEEEELCPNQ